MAELYEVAVHRQLVDDKVNNIIYNMSTLEIDEKPVEYIEKIQSLSVQMSNLKISQPETQEFDIETKLFLLQLLQPPIRTYEFLESPSPYLMEKTIQLENLLLNNVCRYLLQLKHNGYVKFGWKQTLIQTIRMKHFAENGFNSFSKNSSQLSANSLMENHLPVTKFILSENLYYACIVMKMYYDAFFINEPTTSLYRYTYALTKHNGLSKLNISQNVGMKLFHLQSSTELLPDIVSLNLGKVEEDNISNKCLEDSSSEKECEAMIDGELLESADNNVNVVAVHNRSPQSQIIGNETVKSTLSSKNHVYNPKDYFTSIWSELYALYQPLLRDCEFNCTNNKEGQTDNNQNLKTTFNTDNLSSETPGIATGKRDSSPERKTNAPQNTRIPVLSTNSFPNKQYGLCCNNCTTRHTNVPQTAKPNIATEKYYMKTIHVIPQTAKPKIATGTSHTKTVNIIPQTAKPKIATGTSQKKTINVIPQTAKPKIATGTSQKKTINVIPQTAKPKIATGTSQKKTINVIPQTAKPIKATGISHTKTTISIPQTAKPIKATGISHTKTTISIPQTAKPIKATGISHTKTAISIPQTAKPITSTGTYYMKTTNVIPQTAKPIIATEASHTKTINVIPQTAKPIIATEASHTKTINVIPQTAKPIIATEASHTKTINVIPQTAKPIIATEASHTKTINVIPQTAKPIIATEATHTKTINVIPQTAKPIIATEATHTKTINVIPQTANPIIKTGKSRKHFIRRYYHHKSPQNVDNNVIPAKNNISQFGKSHLDFKSHTKSVDVLKIAFEKFRNQLEDLDEYSAEPEADECKVLRQKTRR